MGPEEKSRKIVEILEKPGKFQNFLRHHIGLQSYERWLKRVPVIKTDRSPPFIEMYAGLSLVKKYEDITEPTAMKYCCACAEPAHNFTLPVRLAASRQTVPSELSMQIAVNVPCFAPFFQKCVACFTNIIPHVAPIMQSKVFPSVIFFSSWIKFTLCKPFGL